jgi:YggT family protein
VQEILCALVTAYAAVMLVRVILSWIPPRSGGLATLNRVVFDLTEPVLAPARRVIPPAGVLDLSATVVIFALFILRTAICGG